MGLYAWHQTPPMEDLLLPQIVFRDIVKGPKFWVNREGNIIPKHTVYNIIPKEGVDTDELREYLNVPLAAQWIESHCQRWNSRTMSPTCCFRQSTVAWIY